MNELAASPASPAGAAGSGGGVLNNLGTLSIDGGWTAR